MRKTTSKKTATRAADSAPTHRTLVSDAADAAALARPVMRMADQETFVVLCLSVRNTLLGEPHVIAIGTLTGVEVHPRDVFRVAIAANAAGIVMLHNHPSGDPTPSVEDIELTRRLKACGDLLGIPVVDHVVVTTDRLDRRAKRKQAVICKSLQGHARVCHITTMARSKKSKSDNRVVTYVRVTPEEHARIVRIAEKRGYPHTIASVASEMISKGLAVEVKAAS